MPYFTLDTLVGEDGTYDQVWWAADLVDPSNGWVTPVVAHGWLRDIVEAMNALDNGDHWTVSNHDVLFVDDPENQDVRVIRPESDLYTLDLGYTFVEVDACVKCNGWRTTGELADGLCPACDIDPASVDSVRWAIDAAMSAALSADSTAGWEAWMDAWRSLHRDLAPDHSMLVMAVITSLPAGPMRDTFAITLAREVSARKYG